MDQPSTVLIVEDEEPLRELLRFNLREDGYRVLTAGSAERGLALVDSGKPDLIVLDVALPGMDGLEMCRRVRRTRDIPILFLTAKNSEVDKIVGLKLGGDDYVTKPFSLKELLARIEALDRRARSASRPQGRLLSAGAGKVVLDTEGRRVLVRGKPSSLGPKEFELLRQLIMADGKFLSRDKLMKKVWGHARSMHIETRTVDQHIALLRKKLGPEHDLIETVSKGGYRIRLEVRGAGPSGRRRSRPGSSRGGARPRQSPRGGTIPGREGSRR